MNKDLKNIENLYKQNFKDLEIKPSNNAWTGIDNKIWLTNFKYYFNNLLNTSTISVNSGVWAGISRKLWLRGFLSFNLSKFNIYYVVLFILAGSTFLFNPQDVSNNLVKQEISENIITNPLVEGNTAQPNKIVEFLPNEETNNSEINNSTIIEKQIIVPNKIKVEKSNIKLKIEVNIEKSKFDTIISHEKVFKTEEFIAEYLQINKFEKKTTLLDDKIQLNKNLYLITDTIGYNFKGEPIIKDNSHWSVDVYASPLVSSSILTTQSREYLRYLEVRSEMESPVLHYSAGINVNYTNNNFLIQSGINISELGESYDYKINISYIDTVHYFTYQNSGYMEKDTISYLNLDSLMVGDTSYVSFIEYNWISTYDSVMVVDYDTIHAVDEIREKNRYRYIEIPLMFGFEFEKEKYTCAIKGGVITGLLYKTQGLTLDKRLFTENVAIDDKSMFVKAQFSFVLAANFAYKLDDKFSLMAEPYFRKTINSIIPEQIAYSQKYNSYGLKLGLRYKF